MEYRTVLVQADESRSSDTRIAFAAEFAMRHDAHLACVVPTGILRYLYGAVPDGYYGDLSPLFDSLRAAAGQRAVRFDALAGQAGVGSFEHRISDEEPGFALARQAMCADLVIVGQSDPDDPVIAHAAIPEYVALHAPCPVLVLPCRGEYSPVFERILVAWNASPESARALRQALPLLVRAAEVEVATFDGAQAGGAEPGATDVALYLARHGVKVSLWQGQAGDEVADALLSRASEVDADLLVTGCYGHTRLREILLGGVSRTVLQSMTIPALMAH
jgi:nucleotide-binding universal stress UspA family protein